MLLIGHKKRRCNWSIKLISSLPPFIECISGIQSDFQRSKIIIWNIGPNQQLRDLENKWKYKFWYQFGCYAGFTVNGDFTLLTNKFAIGSIFQTYMKPFSVLLVLLLFSFQTICWKYYRISAYDPVSYFSVYII